ncbi:TetR/AcrR family transcriptional regulator [Glutamicibacter endophyticus]|uniref:TetR/AcrR family transcriptional regulator n=1 Tax=Glutamicibacter endophyticus TaxID=1522174 RepID=UPI003AF06A4C
MAAGNPERILAACAACIAEHGVRGLRVTDVAKRAGVSSGLLYYHFEDRDGLLAATLEYVNATSLASRQGQEATGEQAAAEITRRLLAEIDEDPEVRGNSIVWNEIRAIAVFEQTLAGHLANSTSAWQGVIRDLVTGHGVTDPAVAERSALLLTALVEGLSGRWLSGQISAAEAREALESGISALLST